MPKLIGNFRLGRDAELRSLQDGTPVASLSLAYNYGKPDQSGNRPTTWIDGSLFGKTAEALAPYLLKGSVHEFTLEGLHIQTFDKRDGGQGTKIAARVLSVELGPKVQGSSPAPAPAPRPAPPPRQAPPAPTGGGFDDMDEDIPFVTCSMFYDMTTSKDRRLAKYDY